MKICIILTIFVVVFAENATCLDDTYFQNIAYILENFTLPEEDSECTRQLRLFKNITGHWWTIKMIDAWSKIPSGLLELNTGELGSFDECIEISENDKEADMHIRGKYCIGNLQIQWGSQNAWREQDIQKMYKLRQTQNAAAVLVGFPFALCLPDACSQESIQVISNAVLGVNVTNYVCQNEDDTNPELTTGAIITICFFALIVAVMILSSVYDYWCQTNGKQPASLLLVAFSVYTNIQKLFKISGGSAELQCLNGIRVLSMCWVILGHVTKSYSGRPVKNMRRLVTWLEEWHSMFIASGTLAVDTFLAVGGLLVVYVFMKSVHSNTKFNLFLYYLHRYLRLTPALGAITLVSATILPYFGSGPIWNNIKADRQDHCVKNWWKTILYIQTLFYSSDYCISESWYLNVDMQIYVFSPIFLFVLSKSKKFGSGLLGLMVIVFMIIPFVITWVYELPALITDLNRSSADYGRKYYVAAYTRAAPWFVGGLAGYYISHIKFEGVKFKIHKIVNIIIWLVVLALIFTCVLVGHDTLRGEEYDKWGSALYNTFIRPTFSICVSWVVFACVTGNAGIINTFLSLPVFQIINRFNYSMYLTHLTIVAAIGYALRTGVYFSIFDVFYSFWGVYMFSFIISIFWVLAFESPIVIIEKILLGKGKK